MSTALTLINDAFDDLEIKSAEVELTDSEVATGIRRLNRLMTQLAAGGLNVGFTKVVNKDDDTTIPDWFEDVVVSHLAIRLAPGFGAEISPALAAAAQYALKIAQRKLIGLGPTNYPNTLPLGSGNYDYNYTRYFTDDSTADMLDDVGNTVTDGDGNKITYNE